MFYEQIERKPPVYLRLLLPIPIRTEGRKSEVGDVATCLYRGWPLAQAGYRDRGEPSITSFEVVEQTRRLRPAAMRLSKGGYTLDRERADGGTDVSLETNYNVEPQAALRSGGW